jgi:hypothetical protein
MAAPVPWVRASLPPYTPYLVLFATTPLTPEPFELVKKPAMPLLAMPRTAVPVPFWWT